MSCVSFPTQTRRCESRCLRCCVIASRTSCLRSPSASRHDHPHPRTRPSRLYPHRNRHRNTRYHHRSHRLRHTHRSPSRSIHTFHRDTHSIHRFHRSRTVSHRYHPYTPPSRMPVPSPFRRRLYPGYLRGQRRHRWFSARHCPSRRLSMRCRPPPSRPQPPAARYLRSARGSVPRS